MNKKISAIFLLLFFLLVCGTAEARLTLGVASGEGGVSSAQAKALTRFLAENLQEDVMLREYADAETLINWLERFAVLDIAILPTAELVANPGRFLLLGTYDEGGQLNLVARQGGGADLPQRMAGIAADPRFSPGRKAEPVRLPLLPVAEEDLAADTSQPASVDALIATRMAPLSAPPLMPTRQGLSQGQEAVLQILPGDGPVVTKMVLGVVSAPKGVLRSPAQAESLAAYLESVLPVAITVREFAELDTFTEWFMRHKMIDLALLPPTAAREKLGRDYLPIADVLRSDRQDAGAAELVILRRDLEDELFIPMQRAFMEMSRTAAGQALLSGLNISMQFPESPRGGPAAAARVAELINEQPVPVVAKPRAESIPETGAVSQTAITEDPEPAQPPAVSEIIAKALPELPPVAEAEPVVAPSASPGLQDRLQAPEVLPPADEPVPAFVEEPEKLEAELALQPEDAVPQITVLEPPVVVPLVTIPEVMEVAEVPVSPAPAEMPSGIEVTKTAPIEESGGETVATEVVEIAPELPPLASAEDTTVTPSSEALPESSAQIETAAVLEQQEISDEFLPAEQVVSAYESPDPRPFAAEWSGEKSTDAEILAILGENTVVAMVSQPDIPQELRPPGVPVVRPGRAPRSPDVVEKNLLLSSLPEPLKQVEPPRPPVLLPQSVQDPGIVYVFPFVSVMVPDEVSSRIFDQFIDTMIVESAPLGMQFVILKQGLQGVAPEWLSVRKFVSGEIYAYVEESGAEVTDMRAKARLIYQLPNENVPALAFESPFKNFFQHDASSLQVERQRLADDVASTLAGALLKSLQN